MTTGITKRERTNWSLAALGIGVIASAAAAQVPTIVSFTPPAGVFGTQYSADEMLHGGKTFPPVTSADGHGKAGVFTDLNGDTYADLYLVRGPNYFEVAAQDPAPVANELRLYNSTTGAWDLQSSTGAEDTGAGIGAIAGDFDNDGDIDLYVVNYNEPNVLLRNTRVESGTFGFEDVTAETAWTQGPGFQRGVALSQHDGVVLEATFSAIWADFDRDGDLDLYVSNFDQENGSRPESDHRPPGPGERSTLYLSQLKEMTASELSANNGVPWFIDATMTSGGDFVFDPVANPDRVVSVGVTAGSFEDGRHNTPTKHFETHMASVAADLNNDLWIDLVIVADFRLYIYRNLGSTNGVWNGFELETFDPDSASPIGEPIVSPMGITVGDYDNDGDLDLFTTSTPSMATANDVLTNLWDGTTMAFHHQNALVATRTAWGAKWLDANNDGMLDLIVAMQAQGNVQDDRRDNLFVNNGIDSSGEREFLEDGFGSGLTRAVPDDLQSSLGLMVADFDNDGFVDALARGFNFTYDQLWPNTSFIEESNTNHWLTLHLKGNASLVSSQGWSNTADAIGARIQVDAAITVGGPIVSQIREINSGDSNASSTSSLDVHFGLGDAEDAFVRISWPNGRISQFRFYPAFRAVDKRYVIDESIEVDTDFDSVFDYFDNCPNAPNADQADADNDGVGDACEGSGGGKGCEDCLCGNQSDCPIGQFSLGAGPDFTGDGIVDETDMYFTLRALGYTTGRCDLNKDGIVDVADVTIMVESMGPWPPQ